MNTRLLNVLMYSLIIGISLMTMSNVGANLLDKETKIVVNREPQQFIAYGFHTMGPKHSVKKAKVTSFPIESERGFDAFRTALAFKESQGKYHKVNSLGYLGKYQFGKSTLEQLGVNDTLYFLNSPSLQEKIFVKNLNYNYKVLKDFLEEYEGKEIAGVKVTTSGALAAAHLSGPGGVKRFFRTKGRRNNKDAYGSSVKAYMKKFADYDLRTVLKS
ncbi:peptidoglycan-binding protein LysM [Nonlabens sp. SY33080]|uniref:peptidoglycan-binding protein LysM n=1 Tax=Nonlabens sp. SY33080 TaxID=2719911 RepID=UPI001428B3E0|nr:peptidoglycan-binding protein LysM [Nonlabens sp. SY33080]